MTPPTTKRLISLSASSASLNERVSGEPVKQPRDIEQLLRWAYRDELAKRATSSAEGIWERIADWRSLGAAIDIGGHGPQRYDLGLPAPDALVIESEVALLPDTIIDWQREALSVLGDLVALMDPREKNNAPADSPRSGRANRTIVGWRSRAGEKVTVELEPPRQVIMTNTLRTSALVAMHAKMATRPDVLAVQPRPHHLPAHRGTGPMIVGECRGRNWYTSGSYCPLGWEPAPIAIAQARADYLAWWRGLRELAARLRTRLEKFLPVQPQTPEMPWRT